MKKVDDELCTKCNVVETIEHFFYDCKLVKLLWKEVQNDLKHKRIITEKECILGTECCKHDNLLILIAKLCISKFKYGEYTNLAILYEREKILRI